VNEAISAAITFWWRHIERDKAAVVSHLSAALSAVAYTDPDRMTRPLDTVLCELQSRPGLLTRWSVKRALGPVGNAVMHHTGFAQYLFSLISDQKWKADVLGLLAEIGEPAGKYPEVGSILLSAAQDDQHEVRFQAQRAITHIPLSVGSEPSIVPKLIAALSDPQSGSMAVRVLAHLGTRNVFRPDVLPSVVALVHTPELFAEAADALAEIPGIVTHPEMIATFMALLDDPRTFAPAAHLLVKLPSADMKDRGIIPKLARYLASPKTRGPAARALGQLGAELGNWPEVLEVMAAILRNPDTRGCVAIALVDAGISTGLPAFPQILDAAELAVLGSRPGLFGFPMLEESAAARLRNLATENGESTLNLIQTALLSTWPDPDSRIAIIEVLGQVGTPAGRHAGLLHAMLGALSEDNPGRQLHSAIIGTLGKLGPTLLDDTTLIAVLKPFLTDTDPHIRRRAVVSMGTMGQRPLGVPDVVNAVVRLLADADEWVQGDAAEALGRMAPRVAEFPGVLPTLFSTLGNRSDYVFGKTATAIGRMGEAAVRHPDFGGALEKVIAGWHGYPCQLLQALGQIGQGAAHCPPAFSILLRQLHGINKRVRDASAHSLAKMGVSCAKDPRTIPALLSVLDHNDAAAAGIESFMQLGARIFANFSVRWVEDLAQIPTEPRHKTRVPIQRRP
jgi:HEAT repeat protein